MDGFFNPETVDRLIKKYEKIDQEVHQTFEDDWLMIVLTFNIFLDTFRIEKLIKKITPNIKIKINEEGW